VDDAFGVITGIETTAGDADEAKQLIPLIEQHEANTGRSVRAAVADSTYGTIENFLACDRRGVRSHMTDLQAKQLGTSRRAGIFDHTCFIYDETTDTYRCPAGEVLRWRRHHRARNAWDYEADRGVCAGCRLRSQCTRSKRGRSIKRHAEQVRIDRARGESASRAAKADRRRRKHLVEGSFALGANNHHLKRSRWRRLHRQRIQDHLIAAVQNITILIGALRQRRSAAQAAVIRATVTTLLRTVPDVARPSVDRACSARDMTPSPTRPPHLSGIRSPPMMISCQSLFEQHALKSRPLCPPMQKLRHHAHLTRYRDTRRMAFYQRVVEPQPQKFAEPTQDGRDTR
jgi:hypothetical protein